MPPKPKTRLAASRTTFGDIFLIILFHGMDRAVLALRVCNEDVVAELILSGDQIFLFALALDDLIMTLRVAAENSRRFPGCVENLRRRYFKIVVKHVRLRQMQPFDNVHVTI